MVGDKRQDMELNVESAVEYLKTRGVVARCVTELGGGVSNSVFLVEAEDGSFILKQSLPRLRVKDEWLADRSRIVREMESLVDAAGFLPPGGVPGVLWADAENYAFAMELVAGEAWKNELMAGRVDVRTAGRVGELLGTFVSATWGQEAYREKYGDQGAFNQLRVDPYYRTVALRHPDVAPFVGRLIEESAARRVSLVHGDWSPKNILVSGSRVTLIDFEVVHYGDPCFDAAFCLNHLLLKWFVLPARREAMLEAVRAYWAGLESALPPPAAAFFEPGTLRHLGCLMLARVDGKSPVEYLKDESLREQVRDLAKRLILQSPETIDELMSNLPREDRRAGESGRGWD
jgi:aminoglycoside phosphotransferase (APT) family kinase protein